MTITKHWCGLLGLWLLACLAQPVQADHRTEIESKTREALAQLREHASDVDQLIKSASGVLVFPDVVEMTFGEGGRYGEGALLIEDEPVAYYATAGAPHQVPAADGRKAEVILFMTREALIKFRNTINWKVGMSGGLTRVRVDERGRLETPRNVPPVLGFTFSDKGMTEHLELQGTTINRIAR